MDQEIIKANLLKAFTKDKKHFYHTVPNKLGHLVYVSSEQQEYTIDNLEFKRNAIIEGLLDKVESKFSKVAPSIYFTDEKNLEKLDYELSEDFHKNKEFSNFIESIKDEYRMLEVRDFLLYKEDPEAYEKLKQEEHLEAQRGLWDRLINQQKESELRRKKAIAEYKNDLVKLLHDALESDILYEKKDFILKNVLSKFIFSIIENDEKWPKRNEQHIMGNQKFEPVDVYNDTIILLVADPLSDTYKITLKLFSSELIIDDVVMGEFPTIKDYDFLMKIFSIENKFDGWEDAYDYERISMVINHIIESNRVKEERIKQMKSEVIDSSKCEVFFRLDNLEVEFTLVPGKPTDIIDDKIFEPIEKYLEDNDIDFKRSETNFNSIEFIQRLIHSDVEKLYHYIISIGYMLDSYRQEIDYDFMDLRLPDRTRFGLENKMTNKPKPNFEFDDEIDDDDGDSDDEYPVNNNLTPKDYYFSVYVPQGNVGEPGSIYDEIGEPSSIALVEIEYFNDYGGLDDSFCSEKLPRNVINALNNAGIYGDTEMQEAIWEVIDNTRSEKDIVQSMQKQGFIYNPNIT